MLKIKIKSQENLFEIHFHTDKVKQLLRENYGVNYETLLTIFSKLTF